MRIGRVVDFGMDIGLLDHGVDMELLFESADVPGEFAQAAQGRIERLQAEQPCAIASRARRAGTIPNKRATGGSVSDRGRGSGSQESIRIPPNCR